MYQQSSFLQVCVQGSMGEGALAGMPLQLAGTRKILEFMDWGDNDVMGTFVSIGSIGDEFHELYTCNYRFNSGLQYISSH